MIDNKVAAPIRTDRKPLHELIPLDAPLRILIDPADICNFKCSFCFQNYDKDFKGQIMSMDTFIKTLDRIEEFDKIINIIHLFGFGEPLLNPYLSDFVKIIKERNICKQVAITTNGSRLTKKLSSNLIRSGIDRISISLNGLSDKDFEEIAHYKVNFEKMYSEIQYLYNIRKDCHLHIKINGDCFTDDEKKHFIDTFHSVSDTLNIDHTVDVWPGLDISLNKEISMYGDVSNGMNNVCPQMFYELIIHSDGSVSPCCADFLYYKQNLGNVYHDSLVDIWRGGNYEVCK